MATTTAHDTQTARTLAVVEQVEKAVNRHDIEAVLALTTEDCVFENTFPAPDGTRHEGRAAIRAAFAWTASHESARILSMAPGKISRRLFAGTMQLTEPQQGIVANRLRFEPSILCQP